VRKYLRQLEAELYFFAAEVGAAVQPLTVSISNEGIGEVFLPSRDVFEKISPQNQPTGLVFADGSFLVFYEVVRFGYRNETATEPAIYRLSYGYHYQRPVDHFYFRFDHHPGVGDVHTHPLYHLHSAGWLFGATKLQEGPRYEVSEITLAKVFRLVLVTFPSVKSAL
jgi:hypothetical protein